MDFDTKIEDVDINSLLDTVDTTDVIDNNPTPPDANDDSNIDDDSEDQDQDDNKEGDDSDDDEELSDEELLFNQFANELYKKGILDSYENIKSEDDLYEAFQESIRANEFKDLTEQQKIVLEAFRNGIPEEDIILNQKEIADYSGISIEDIETKSSLRENILTKFYLSKGMDEKEAKDLASVINDSSTAIEKTTDALNKLKEEAATYLERQKEENERLQQEQIKEMQKTIENIQGNACSERMPHGVLLIQKSRICSRLTSVPCPPLINTHSYFFLRVILIHDSSMSCYKLIHMKCLVKRLIPYITVKVR